MSGARRIVAGVSGSPGSVHALRHAAELARQHDAVLVPLLAWVPPCGDLDERKHPCLQLRELWHDDAWQRLWAALDAAFGGLPAGIATQPVVLRGKPGKVLAGLARQPGDILVVGAGRRGRLRRLLCCTVSRYCLANADCPVLAVPPPTLARQAGHSVRGWAFRRRLNLPAGVARLPEITAGAWPGLMWGRAHPCATGQGPGRARRTAVSPVLCAHPPPRPRCGRPARSRRRKDRGSGPDRGA
jgi:nucleotide-binding universal stress UspA family protein